GFLPALPRNLSLLFPTPTHPPPIPLSSLPLPATRLSTDIASFARSVLPAPTFNHSMRVYLFGLAILHHHLPSITFTHESYYLLSLLHDLGTTISDTALSFEYSGALRAREQLLSLGADVVLADSVCEAIIRHQDVFLGDEAGGDEGGKVTALTAVVHLATLFDNVGKFEGLVNKETVEETVREWPRLGWSGCFCEVLKKEGERKPWCHTSTIGVERFREEVKGNGVMNCYE
ncbi:cyanamide hydratase, partial [Wilcoxina mikolae CBS 423.85]